MKLATIERIHSIQNHFNNAVLNLEVAKIKEWPVVIPKGQFKNGDPVVFIRIDSICPKENAYFSFLAKQNYKIWNAKFKGAPSQGLVCPLSILGEGDWKEGDDVSEKLGITKYEKPVDVSIGGDIKGNFPKELVSITDEDNGLNYPEILDEFRNERCYITVKADGSSMTIINDNGNIRVCSRRFEQKEGTGLWRFVDAVDLPNKLKSFGQNIAIQAEACGGRIQGNPMGLNKSAFFVFNIKDIATGRWYGWDETKETCKVLGIPTVNVLMENFVFDESWNMAKLQSLANSVEYTTDNGKKVAAEGIVIRTMQPKYSAVIGKSLSIKILNQNY